MTVNVDLPDGRRVEFEDGVTQDVIERTTKSLLSAGDAKQPATSGTTMNTVGGLPLVSTGVAGIEEGGAPYSTGHVGEAAAEGYRAAPRLYSQEQLDDANKTIFGYAINNPLMQIANQVLPVGNALFRGGQQFVQEALSPISPALGRDVAAMPEAFIGGPHLGPLRPEPGSGLPCVIG